MKKQFVIDNEIVDVNILEENPSFVLFQFNGEEYSVNLGGVQDGKMTLTSGGKNHSVIFQTNTTTYKEETLSLIIPREEEVNLSLWTMVK